MDTKGYHLSSQDRIGGMGTGHFSMKEVLGGLPGAAEQLDSFARHRSGLIAIREMLDPKMNIGHPVGMEKRLPKRLRWARIWLAVHIGYPFQIQR